MSDLVPDHFIEYLGHFVDEDRTSNSLDALIGALERANNDWDPVFLDTGRSFEALSLCSQKIHIQLPGSLILKTEAVSNSELGLKTTLRYIDGARFGCATQYISVRGLVLNTMEVLMSFRTYQEGLVKKTPQEPSLRDKILKRRKNA